MKKIVIFLILILIPITIYAYPRGDVNGSREVDVTDYILIRKHILKNPELTGEQLKRADVNGDNVISTEDYIIIRKIILGITDSQNSVSTPVPTKTPSSNNVAVTGVSLNKSTLELKVGKKETLLATVSPSNATNKELTWSSSKDSVATVDANGKVTAISEGTTKITVKTKDGSKKATCTVTVTYDITTDKKYDKKKEIVSCSSDTLKYRIFEVKNDMTNHNQYIAVIWVADAYYQMNTALSYLEPPFKANSAYNILKKERETFYNNNSKACMIAINGSFFYMPKDTTKWQAGYNNIISKGKVYRDNKEKEDIWGFTNNYSIKHFSKDDKTDANVKELQEYGIRNTFRCSHSRRIIEENGKYYYSDSSAANGKVEIKATKENTKRTQFCKYDKNNYVLMVGEGEGDYAMTYIYRETGCNKVYNFDGSDSSQMYYQNGEKVGGNDIISVREVYGKSSAGRRITDMIYFSEDTPKMK